MNYTDNCRPLTQQEVDWVKHQRSFLRGKGAAEQRKYVRANSVIRHIEQEHLHTDDETMLRKTMSGSKHGDSRFTNEEIMYSSIASALDDNMATIARFVFDKRSTADTLLIEDDCSYMDDDIGTGFVSESENKNLTGQHNNRIHAATTKGVCLVIARSPNFKSGFVVKTACPAVHPDTIDPQDIVETDPNKDLTPILENMPEYKSPHTSSIRKIGLRKACNDKALENVLIDYQDEFYGRPEQVIIMDNDAHDQKKPAGMVMRQLPNKNIICEYAEMKFEQVTYSQPTLRAVPTKRLSPDEFAARYPQTLKTVNDFLKTPPIQQLIQSKKGPSKPSRPIGLNTVEHDGASLESPEYS